MFPTSSLLGEIADGKVLVSDHQTNLSLAGFAAHPPAETSELGKAVRLLEEARAVLPEMGSDHPPIAEIARLAFDLAAGDVDLARQIVQGMIERGRTPYSDWLMLNPSLARIRIRPEFPAIRDRSLAALAPKLGLV